MYFLQYNVYWCLSDSAASPIYTWTIYLQSPFTHAQAEKPCMPLSQMHNAAGPITNSHTVGLFKKSKQSRSRLHLYTVQISLIHAHVGSIYMYICTSYSAYATGPILHMHTIQAPFIRTRLLAQFTLHISRSLITFTHIWRCCEYPHAEVPFTHAHSFVYKKVALYIITFVSASARMATWTYFNGQQAQK